MTTVALLLLITGGLMIQRVSKGRGPQVLTDLSDLVTAALSGDFDAVSEVAGRTGEGLSTAAGTGSGTTDSGTGATADVPAGQTGQALLATAKELGARANHKYVWGSTGPSSYDCSGLVWASMKALGYKGSRFTTATIGGLDGGALTKVSQPAVGDLVVWTGGSVGHVGIVSGNDEMYSALNSSKGILTSSISSLGTPSAYYRINPGGLS